MKEDTYELLTAPEIEDRLGSKYFYRQKIYRLAEAGRVRKYAFRDQTCFLTSDIVKAFLEDLEQAIHSQHPDIDMSMVQVMYEPVTRRIVVDGLFGKGISADTSRETQEDTLRKIATIKEWEADSVVGAVSTQSDQGAVTPSLDVSGSLPEELMYIKVETGVVEGVEVKSFILISLPSLAQFIGVRTDNFSRWIAGSTFSGFILSANVRHLNGPQHSGPWKKGLEQGYVPLLPMELIPEVLIAVKQANFKPQFPQKAEVLYELAKTALEAVGLGISGNKQQAAEALAKVGEGLGLQEADQIIALLRQYANRDFQVQTHKGFVHKVRSTGGDYLITTGTITVGVTGKNAATWMKIGQKEGLKSRERQSAREVMRHVAPADSVGMTFAEGHYTKNPDTTEAIKTGRQGKSFYRRLKEVGLLEEPRDEDKPVTLEVRGKVR
ncbi:MAG: hypothetical protein JWN01_136 [Patescibacteria group bacterium]|nr:hypothetical protein [Patescibacteria group bacterium]